MAVQMPNLGILKSWNFWSLNNYWNPYWDIRVTDSLDYGSFTAVVAAFATSIRVGDLLWMDLQTRGLAARRVHM